MDSPDQIELAYRLLDKVHPPRRTLCRIPGWAGDAERRADGSVPQPWHCIPFIEGATYGLEFVYPFESECRVSLRDGRVVFDGAFSAEQCHGSVWPPFQTTNPGHYSIATLVDLQVPEGFALRVEPHPRFFNDATGCVPAAVIGNVRTSWWPLYLFITFRAPRPGESHVFKKGEPYAQAIVVPCHQEYALRPMDAHEAAERETFAQRLLRSRRVAPRNQWVSPDGLRFDDLYRRLRSIAERDGDRAVRAFGLSKAGDEGASQVDP